MKQLLMIAYFFPPIGGGGVQRTLNFARNLPSLGWAPTVLCAGDDLLYRAKDPELLEGLPSEVKVVTTPEGTPGQAVQLTRRAIPRRFRSSADRALWIPDRFVGWLPNAVRAGSRLVQNTRFDCIYSTGAPWTDHLVALALARKSHLPWVSDFRDPWTESPLARFASAAHASVHRKLESTIYAHSRRIIANTPAALGLMQSAFPESSSKAVCITNGFAESDFRDLPEPISDGKIRLGYAGSLYPGRGGGTFARLIRAAVDHRPELRSKLRIRLMGDVHGRPFEGLDDIFERLPYVPHRQAIRELARCRAVVQLDFDTTAYSPFVPQKLYLYLRLGRPIVAIGNDGESNRLLEAFAPDALLLKPDATDSTSRFAAWLAELEGRIEPTPTQVPSGLEAYEWSTLTRRLSEILDEATP